MDEDVVYIIHNEDYSTIKRLNHAICSNLGGSRDDHTK